VGEKEEGEREAGEREDRERDEGEREEGERMMREWVEDERRPIGRQIEGEMGGDDRVTE
jgi:hypothetical protein